MLYFELQDIELSLEIAKDGGDYCMRAHVSAEFMDYEGEYVLTKEDLTDVVKYLSMSVEGNLTKGGVFTTNSADVKFRFYKDGGVDLILQLSGESKNALILHLENGHCVEMLDYLKKLNVGSNSNFDDGVLHRFIKVSFDPSDDMEFSYLDEEKIADETDYVWVPRGRFDKPCLAYVVEVGDYLAKDAPYPVDKTKSILRLATEEECEAAEANW